MQWWHWYLLGSCTLGLVLWQPFVRYWCFHGIIKAMRKFHELLSNQDRRVKDIEDDD